MSDKKVLAVFASDKGAGDVKRADIMSKAGHFLAGKGFNFVVLAQNGEFCVPFITSARSAGADIKIIADEEFKIPKKLADIELKKFKTSAERYAMIDELSDVFVGLPCSLLSAKFLFEVWVENQGKKPVILLNKNRSFEFMRGFVQDVVSHKVRHVEKQIQHADNIEDLYNRIKKLV